MTAFELEQVLANHRIIDLPSVRAVELLVALVRELRQPTPDKYTQTAQALAEEVAARSAGGKPSRSRTQTGKPKAVLKAKASP